MAPAVRRSPVTLPGRPALAAVLAVAALGAALVNGVLEPREAIAGRMNVVAKAGKTAKAVSARAAEAKAAGSESATTTATPATPASTSPGVQPAAKAPAKAAATTGKTVAKAAQSAPGVLRVTVPNAPQEERVTYHYNALGRRDPFKPLVGSGFVGMDVGGAAPPDVGGIKVVGIVWGASDRFALVEDPRGNSLVLRKGDKVMNGVVESLKRDALVVKMDMDGVSQSVTIPVTRKGEQNEGN